MDKQQLEAEAELNKIYTELMKDDLKEAKKMLSRGFNFRVSAIFHRKNGGDDAEICAFLEINPTKEQVLEMFASKRSLVLDDYVIKPLKDLIKNLEDTINKAD